VVANFVPELLVFDIPFIFRDTAHARAVVDGPIGQDILAKVKDKGVIGLGYGENGFRHLTNNKRQVETPADLSGLTIRTMENPIHITAFKELGARPTPIAWPELYAALQQGVVDGQENPLSNLLTAKLYQVQKYLTLTGHVYAPTLVMISPAAWNKLTPDQQKILKDAVGKAIIAQRKAVEELEANAVKTLKDQGMQVEEKVDNAQFSAKLAPAYAQLSKQFGQKTLDAIRDTK
jgi:tripartite ATP-independent transporter DctP family solute receptor